MKNQNFSPDWPELGFMRAELGLNMEENAVFKSLEKYYTVSIYNYYEINFFLVLIKHVSRLNWEV